MQISDRKNNLFFLCLCAIYHNRCWPEFLCVPIIYAINSSHSSHIICTPVSQVFALCVLHWSLTMNSLGLGYAGWEFYQSDLQTWNCQEGEKTLRYRGQQCSVMFSTSHFNLFNNTTIEQAFFFCVCEDQYYTLLANFYHFATNFATYTFQQRMFLDSQGSMIIENVIEEWREMDVKL